MQLDVASLLPAAAAGFVGSLAGAWAVTVVSPEFLRRLLPFVPLAVLLYTLARKDLGREHVPHLSPRAQTLAACGSGLVLGWYDGFFGPGTGSFFVFRSLRGMFIVVVSALILKTGSDAFLH